MFRKIRNILVGMRYASEDKRRIKKYTKIYPDYDESDGTMYEDMVQIYSPIPSHILYGMTDFEIIYFRDTKKYHLSLETAYLGTDLEDISSWEIPYLERSLNIFTKYMDNNNLNKYDKPFLFMQSPSIKDEADSIEELYRNFKMFVHGFREIKEECIKEINKEK